MISKQQPLLSGIVEADETYVGGKPRKSNKHNTPPHGKSKRSRGTNKTPVIGVVERKGNVSAKVSDNLKAGSITRFLKDEVDPQNSLLIADEFTGYVAACKIIPHSVINHQKQYVDRVIHTNTILSSWALPKRSYMGSQHHYSKKWMPLYIAEQCWKYNNRENDDAFLSFLKGVVA